MDLAVALGHKEGKYTRYFSVAIVHIRPPPEPL